MSLSLFRSSRARPGRSGFVRYGVAVLAVLTALACSILVQTSVGQPVGFQLLLLAVAIAAWLGGPSAGFLAIALGVGGARLLLGPGMHPQAAADLTTIPGLLIFSGTALALVAITIAVRSDLQKAETRVAQLEQQYDETRFNLSHTRIGLDQAKNALRTAESERKRLAESLQTSEDRMRIAQAGAAFCVFDWEHESGKLTLVGDPKPIFADTIGELTDLESFYAQLPETCRERVRAQVEEALQEKRPFEVEFPLGGDGERWVLARGSTAYDVFGKPQRTIGIFQEISARKKTELSLLRHAKLGAASRLAASIAHEINNPLAAVTNLLYIVRDDRSLSHAGRQYLSMAEQELQRLGTVTKQALGFYKESAQPAEINLTSVMDEVIEFSGRNLPATLKVERQYGPVVPVSVVQGELRQVFANLLSNAADAVGGQGSVRVSIHGTRAPRRPGVVVAVEDDGPGIPRENLEAVFEPFFTTKPEVGTGLGLWVVKELVEKNGGTIDVQSSIGEQHGTRVVLFFPAAQAARPTPAPPVANARSSQPA